MPITPSCQLSSASDVAALRLPGRRPCLDLIDGRAEDPVLDRLPVAVQLLEPLREPRRLVRVVGEQELERGLGAAEAPGGVDARREPERDRALVDRRRDRPGPSASAPRFRAARASFELLQARRSRARGSRRRAVRRRRSSPARRGRAGRRGRARRAPARACRRRRCRTAPGTGTRDGRVATIGQSGSSSPGRWWSVTITARPSRFASATSSTAVMPQSTVRIEPVALLGQAGHGLAGQPVALLEAARQMPADVGAERRGAS